MSQDAIIIVGTAIIGGLLLNLQKRVPVRQQVLAGWGFLLAGWAMMAMERLLPNATWKAIDMALQLTGLLLLLPIVMRMMREQKQGHKPRF